MKQKYTQEMMDHENLFVDLGRHNLKQWHERGSIIIPVTEIEIHPQWKTSTDNFDADIALIVLEKEIQFSRFIRPICFPPKDDLEFFKTRNKGMIVNKSHTDFNRRLHSSFISCLRLVGDSMENPLRSKIFQSKR